MRAAWIAAVALLGGGLLAPAGAQQPDTLGAPGDTVATPADSAAAAVAGSAAAPAPADSVAAPAPPGPAPAAGAPPGASPADTSSGDPLYDQLAADARPGQINYRADRLTLYPSDQVILLSGNATAQQDSTVATASRIAYVRDENIIQAFGGASVRKGANSLEADTLFYDQGEGIVTTFGASTLRETGQTVEGENLRYSMDRQSGVLAAGRTEYDRWFLRGEDMQKIGERTFVVDEGTFTTDPEDPPDYHFAAQNIKLRQEDVIVARPVVLYVSDVPIFYLPWYLEPLGQGRKSGILRPKIGLNTLINASGEERNVQDLGFYWAISEFMDAQVALDWFSESRTILRFDYRYALRYILRGQAHYEQVWNRNRDSKDTLLRLSHNHDFDPSTQLQVDGNISTSRQFFDDNSFDPDRLLQRALRSNASFSRRFTWGNLTVGAFSDFQLQQERTDFKIPQLNLSLNTRPLFPGSRLEAGWKRNLQVGAATSFDWDYSTQGDSLTGEDEVIRNTQTSVTRATLSGPFDLLGFINVTPSVDVSEILFNNRVLPDPPPDTPIETETPEFGHLEQVGASLSLAANVFRVFQGGPGPITKLRHTLAPQLSLRYQPSTRAREELPLGFPGGGGQEVMTAAFTLRNDLDVKVRETTARARRREEEEERLRRAREAGLLRPRGELTFEEQARLDSMALADSLAEVQDRVREDSLDVQEDRLEESVEEQTTPDAALEEAAAAEEQRGVEGGRGALPDEEEGLEEQEFTERTVRLFSLTNRTSFDFVRNRDPRLLGLSRLTTDLSSNVSSAVSVGISVTHDLVEVRDLGEDRGTEEAFDPFLSGVNTVVRFGGSGSRRGFEGNREGRGRREEVTDAEGGQGAFSDGVGLGDQAPGFETIQSSSLGRWDVDLTHSLSRARAQESRQSLRFGTSFSPTQNWSLRYRTGFNISDGEFQDQSVSLVRDLNRWQATLNLSVFPQEPQDRVLVEFAVFLRDIPDLRIPYRTRRE
ncbi:MAG: LPS-assembly protein LptD [Gemmatimonadota bacterium]